MSYLFFLQDGFRAEMMGLTRERRTAGSKSRFEEYENNAAVKRLNPHVLWLTKGILFFAGFPYITNPFL